MYKKIVFSVLGVVTLCAGALTAVFFMSQPSMQEVQKEAQHATVLIPARGVPAFTLQNHWGESFTNASLKGHWTLLFFGFTFCPDICPTTLAQLSTLMPELAKEGLDIPQVVFVTLDPKRDTVEKLAQYVPHFYPDFVGVRGDDQQLTVLTKALGVVSQTVSTGQGADDYTVDHSAHLFLINPNGELQALFSYPHALPTLLKELSLIQRAFRS